MSYILEALKKSEKRRKRGTVPDVLAVQEIVISEPSRVFRTSVIIGAMVLIGGVLAWWLAPWPARDRGRTPQAPPAVSSSPGEATKSPSPEASAGNYTGAARKMTPQPGPARGQEKAGSEGHSPTEAPAGDREVPMKQASGAVVTDAQDQEMRKKPAVTRAETADLPPPENRLYQFKELPEAVRKRLPDVTLTALLYSDSPPSRMVRINGRMMREGDDLSPGIRLEEITAEGVVLKYQGYRFAVDVK